MGWYKIFCLFPALLLFVIFLTLMICGRLLVLSCKQVMSKHYCFKKFKITRFQSFLKVCVISSKFKLSHCYVVHLKPITTFPFSSIYVIYIITDLLITSSWLWVACFFSIMKRTNVVECLLWLPAVAIGLPPSNHHDYGWNIYADISHRLWWIKIALLFVIVHQ